MKNENIDISQISSMKIEERKFPMKHEYRITISEKAFEEICTHASANSTVEICGVLIGEIYKDNDGPYLEITNTIKGEYADNSAGEVKFTHETWSYINNIKDSEFSNERIVGWYHSHPRFGVFLSDQDMFIHKNFFNQPWQVAFVIDPIANDYGFLFWSEGKTVRCQNFWVNGLIKDIKEDKNHIKNDFIKNVDLKIDNVSNVVKKGLRPSHYFFGLIVFVVLILLNYAVINNNFNNLIEPFKQYWINENFVNTDDIHNALSQNKYLSSIDLKTIRKKNSVWCSGKVITLHQKETVAKIIGSFSGIESIDLQGVIATNSYTVLTDDTLGKISKKIYGTSDRSKDIFEANKEKIKDQNKIQPFINLIIPE